MMRDAGFVDVEERMLQLPTCGWPRGELYFQHRHLDRYKYIPTDQREYEVGVANRDNVQRMLASVALYPLTEILRYACQKSASDIRTLLTIFCRMPIQEVQVLIAQARLEADDPQFKVRCLPSSAKIECRSTCHRLIFLFMSVLVGNHVLTASWRCVSFQAGGWS